jgi:hypothetical protein
MGIQDTVEHLSEKYHMSHGTVYDLIGIMSGKQLVRHPIAYILNHQKEQLYTGRVIDRYLQMKQNREEKYSRDIGMTK